MRRITVYGPDCLPVLHAWQFLPDFRPTEEPPTASIRLTVVRSANGSRRVRVSAQGLKQLGVSRGELVAALLNLLGGWMDPLASLKAA
jgi:hypothetical protein